MADQALGPTQYTALNKAQAKLLDARKDVERLKNAGEDTSEMESAIDVLYDKIAVLKKSYFPSKP